MSNDVKEPFKLGFIGGSKESAVGYTHKISAEMDGRWRVVAGCFSQRQTINQATANEWQVDTNRLYYQWSELLVQEKNKLDAIVVLTPTPSHSDIVIAALEAGFPVVCDKALAATLAELSDIEAAIENTQGFLAVTYNYTGYPILRELKSLIEQGELGTIQQIQVEMPQEGFLRLDDQGNKPSPQAWRLRDAAIPTVSLDLGVHLHHLIHYLTNEQPESVVAMQSNNGFFDHIIDTVDCLIRYSGNISCHMWYTKTALGHRNGMKIRVYGDKASAEWEQINPEDLLVSYQNGTKVIRDRAASVTVASQAKYNRFKPGHPAGFIEAFANLYGDIADALTHHLRGETFQSPDVCGVNIAKDGLKLFNAVADSVARNQWVHLSHSTENKRARTWR